MEWLPATAAENGIVDMTDAERLPVMFRHFAEQEFRTSPCYERLALFLADQPALARPLLAAPRRQQRAILYFAAVQYLLRTSAAGHPLAGYLPVLGGARTPDEGLIAAFTDLVTAYGTELTALCATRFVQTNEAGRAALLRPGFGRAAELVQGRPLALVELGTSAGLLLLPDRYAYRYTAPDGSRTHRTGRVDAPLPLVLECEVRGRGWPEPAMVPITLADRAGIDVCPVDATDRDAVAWLRSCVWPEHVDRLDRLDAALVEAAAIQPRLVPGDMVAELPSLLSTVDSCVVPCVFASNALTYLPREATGRLVDLLAEQGAARDLVVVLNESSRFGAELLLGRRPAEAGPPGVLAVGLLTLVAWRNGRATVEVLARTGPHGQWVEWVPQEYGFTPLSRSTA
ncbi:MAG TPA: DUF2332 domain-containing protein [Micromonosporaceae bacterium]|nr:DUF2332 domain-containing protein [Micromonosporaceae bacterium]